MNMRAVWPLVLATALLTGCATGGDRAGGARVPKPRVLTLANAFGDANDLDLFIAEVDRRSAGTLRIEPQNRWPEARLISDVTDRAADLGVLPSRAWDAVDAKAVRALHAPLLIDSYALQQRVVESPLVNELLAGLEPLGLTGIGVLAGPMRKPLAAAQPLAGPEDYRGLTIGIQRSAVADATFRALGARPAAFAIGGRITGFDAIEQQLPSVIGNRYADTAKYVTANVNLWPRPLIVFANQAAFDSLAASQRDILRRAVVGVAATQTARMRADDHEFAANLCRAGEQFVVAGEANLAALRRAVAPVYAALRRDPATRALIARIEALRNPKDRAPDALRCALTVPTATQQSRLDGVWLATTTPHDHAPGEPDSSPSNYGRWTYVFGDGRFAFTQENGDACTWGYGTFKVTGDHVAWSFTDGGGLSPDNATNKPGEYFVFGWSLYHDTLRLTPVTGAISPENFRIKPWRRIAATPARRFLSASCAPPAEALAG